MKPFVKKRAMFMFLLFPFILITQQLGIENIMLTGMMAGILGGVSVILFPDSPQK